MIQYAMKELKYNAPAPVGNMVEVDITAQFTAPDGKSISVKGFYDGDDTYIVRFYPEQQGTYTYEVSGIINDSGSLVCEVGNDNGLHGIVRADGTHFRYGDGTWFYPFGTTVYALVHQEKELIDQTMSTLKDAPFNKIRMCVFPKDYDFNKNEPPYYPYEKDDKGKWDYSKPSFEYYHHLESVIEKLMKLGIQCDLILFHPYDRWGFAHMSKEEIDMYIDYITRRLSAFPNIWWSLANEFDIMSYSFEDWERIAKNVHAGDPYSHLLSNHNCIEFWDFENEHTTHVCLQIKKVDDINHTIEKYKKPVMVDECCYEGTIQYEWGNISGKEMMNRFWKCVILGGYCTHGETFLCDDDILWWSKGGVLKGESMPRITFLKEIIDGIQGPLIYCGDEFTKEKYDALRNNPETCENDFWSAVARAPWERAKEAMNGAKDYCGHYRDDAYLRYFERRTPAIGTFNLPKEGNYNVEIIDAWNMTRNIALKGVNGNVKVDLPGKEWMAIYAYKV